MCPFSFVVQYACKCMCLPNCLKVTRKKGEAYHKEAEET